jgi:hypothetical protein
MTHWHEEEDESGEPSFGDEDGPDEEEVPSKDGDDGFDDIPATHMGDEEYDAFIASEIDAKGRVKGDPPVTAIILGITAAILLVWILFFR